MRIVELEAFVKAFALKVEFSPVKYGVTLRVDQHFSAIAFKHHIFGRWLVGVFEFVSEAGATCGLHAQTNANTFATFGNVFFDVVGGGLGECDWHDVILPKTVLWERCHRDSCGRVEVAVAPLLQINLRSRFFGNHVLRFVIQHRCLDRVFGKDGAVNFYRRQRELFGDLRVLQVHRLVERFAFDPFGHER